MYCHRHHHHCYQYHELVHFLYHSQVWVGNLIGGRDNTFDITTAAFSDEGAKLYDFPRNENCKLQYCNVEGLAWVDGGDQGGNGAAAAGEEEARVPQVSGLRHPRSYHLCSSQFTKSILLIPYFAFVWCVFLILFICFHQKFSFAYFCL